MKKIILSFSWLITVLIISGLAACRSINEVEWYIPNVIDTHTTKLVASWDGAYTGTILSSGGEGVNALIMLNRDDTYMLRYSYVARPESVFISRGSFKWDRTEEMITLKVKDLPPYYKVTENKLIQLDLSDLNGKYITANPEKNYVMKRIAP